MAWPLVVKMLLGLGGGALLFGLGAKEAGAKTKTTPAGKVMPPWLLFQYQQAKRAAKTNPRELDAVAELLRKNGFPTEADELEALARARAVVDSPNTSPVDKITAAAITEVAKIQAETPVSVVKVPAMTVTATASKTPVTLTPTQLQAKKVSDHLNALVKARGSVSAAKGKEDTSMIRTFQQTTGLKNDGMYGPKSALMLGRYFGDVPLVFYWPKGTLPNTEVPKYRSNLQTLALEAEQKSDLYSKTRAGLLRISSDRERGQGYGSGVSVKPTDTPMTSAEIRTLQQQVASMFFSNS